MQASHRQAPPPTSASRPNRRRQGFVAIFSLLALVGSSSYLLGRATNPGGVFSAPSSARQSGSGGGLFAAARTPMPTEVVAYLRWLKWFESERHRLQLNQIFSLAPLATTAAYADLLSEDAPPIQGPAELAVAKRFEEKVSPVVRGWGATVDVFDKQHAPADCQALAQTYRSSLTTTKSALGTILEKTVGTIKQLAGQKNKEELAQPTLSWLQEQKDNKSLSNRADDGFYAAQLALEKLRGHYRDIPADIDSSHFSIAPDKSTFTLPALPTGLLGK